MTETHRSADWQGASPTYVSMKAFGDFVIAATSLRGFGNATRRPRLTVPSHLADLARVVATDVQTVGIPLARPGVPALFDVKSAGAARAALSAVDLFTALANLPPVENEVLVFDNIGIRETVISVLRPRTALPQADNIYSAYHASLREFELRPEAGMWSEGREAGGKVGIFPASRIEQKSIPLELLARLLERSQSQGGDAVIYLLEGEREDVRKSGLAYVGLSRTFGALAQAVKACRCVISADSLPAHLAENFGIPSFVLTPKPNEYWLPASTFKARAWAEFGDAAAVDMAARFTH